MNRTKQNDPKYVNLTKDPGFKATFRDPDNIDALKLLLNTFLPEERKVQSLEFVDREMDGLSTINKTNIYDVHCKDQDGRDFIVEMQCRDFRNYMTRCFAYSAYAYAANIQKGDAFFNSAVPVYLISFIDEPSHDPRINNSTNLVKRCYFSDNEGQNFENQFISLIFVRLYAVDNSAKPDESSTAIERCCWLMKNLPKMEEEPEENIIGEFDAILKAAEYAAYDNEKKIKYKAAMDYESLKEILREQDRSEGRADAKAEIAKNMLSLGIELDKVMQCTGLTAEEIRSL